MTRPARVWQLVLWDNLIFLERVKVFLLSDLDEEAVEDLGVAHVGNTEQVERLSRQYASCILLGNAQHAFLATPAQ